MDVTPQDAAPKPHPQSRINRIRQVLKPISLFVFSGAQVLDLINATGLLFSTEAISEKFGVELNEATWVLSAYSLTFASFILIGGRLGDTIGHRTLFISGLAVFAVCSIINATVQNIYALFVFRAIQGIGAAGTVPTSFALVAMTFSGQRQALAFALVGSAAAIGSIIGVVLGGVFASTALGYRGLMYLSFGLSMMFIILAFLTIPNTPRQESKAKQLDFVGACILVCGSILVVFGFTSAPNNWNSARAIAPIVIGALLLIFFFTFESYGAKRYFKLEPLIPKEVWSYPNFTAVILTAPFIFASLFAYLLATSEFLILLRGESTLTAAIQTIPAAVAFALASIVGGGLYSKISPKWFMTGGPIMTIAGVVLYAQVDHETYWRYIFASEILVGAGIALYFSTFINVATNSAPLHMQGLVAGVCQTAGQLGTSMGYAITTSELGNRGSRKSFQTAFYTFCGYCAVAAIVSLVLLNNKVAKAGQQAKQGVSGVQSDEPVKSEEV